MSNEELESNYQWMQICMGRIVAAEPSVVTVKTQLLDKYFRKFKFWYTELKTCQQTLSTSTLNNVDDHKCFKSMEQASRKNYCANVWGDDGCMLNVYTKYCGENIAKEMVYSALTFNKDDRKCISEYFG